MALANPTAPVLGSSYVYKGKDAKRQQFVIDLGIITTNKNFPPGIAFNQMFIDFIIEAIQLGYRDNHKNSLGDYQETVIIEKIAELVMQSSSFSSTNIDSSRIVAKNLFNIVHSNYKFNLKSLTLFSRFFRFIKGQFIKPTHY